jgi:hypothetical protein
MKMIRQSLTIAFGISPFLAITSALAEPPAISIAQRQGSNSVEQCVQTSAQAMQQVKLQEIETDAESVTGTNGETRVVIFCNAEKAGLIQTIIVAGANLQENEGLVEALKQALP